MVIPPLRERPEDIPLLVEHFSRQLPNQKRLTPEALRALNQYEWPGNVRELHFAVERASLLSEHDLIDTADLPPEILERSTGSLAGRGSSPVVAAPVPLPAASSDDEDEEGPDLARVRAALEQAKWRREKAAEILGVSPRTLYRWIKKLGL